MKNRKSAIIAIVLVLLSVFLYSLAGGQRNTSGEEGETDSSICFNTGCFKVETVSSPTERERGLMYRTHMEDDHGMLFIFEREGYYPFWMKNTLIPLDMIWITQDMKVAHIASDAQPCKPEVCPLIKPDANATYVLEVNGGRARELNISVGDEVTYKYTAV